MADSIFQFADKFGISSPFGDWLPKQLHITYRGYSVQGADYIVLFNVRAEGMSNVKVEVRMEETEIFANELVASSKFLLKDSGTNTCDLRFPKTVLDNLSQTIFEGKFQFIGRATCEGVADALTPEFELSGEEHIRAGKGQPKKTCFCNRDFTEDELKSIIIELRKGELIAERVLRDKQNNPILDDKGRKQYYWYTKYGQLGEEGDAEKIFMYGHEKVNPQERSFENFTKQLNLSLKKDEINTCIRKIHFLAQACHESEQFSRTYETTPSASVSGGPFYRGRGILHITHDYNYNHFYKTIYKNEPTLNQLKEFVPTVATSLERACLASTWYWRVNKINKYADLDEIYNVSAAVNYQAAINGNAEIRSYISGTPARIRNYELLKKLMNYENCRNNVDEK